MTPIRLCSHSDLDLDQSIACPGCGHSAISIIGYLQDRLRRAEAHLHALAEAKRAGTGHLVHAWYRVEAELEREERRTAGDDVHRRPGPPL